MMVNDQYYGGAYFRAEFDLARAALGRAPLTEFQRDEVHCLLDRAAERAGSNPAAAAATIDEAQERLRSWGAGALAALGQVVIALMGWGHGSRETCSRS